MKSARAISCPDPETLAAFVDRRLPEDERDRVTEHLAECPDCHEVFVETVRFLEDEPAEQVEPGRARGVDEVQASARTVRPGPWGGRWSGALRIALPLAATVLMAVGVWVIAGPSGPLGGRELPTVTGLTAELDVSGLEPTALTDGHGWPVTRGTGSAGPAAVGAKPVPPEVAFRLGVLVVDLEAARRAGATDAAILLAGRIERLLDEEVDLAEPLVGTYRELRSKLESGDGGRDGRGGADGAREIDDLAAYAASLVEERVGPERFRLGAWAEAGRLAASAGGTRYFERREVRRVAELLEGRDLEPGLAAEVHAIAAVLRAGVDPADLPTVNRRFADLVREGGGRI